MSEGLVSPETSLLGLQMPHFHCLLTRPILYMGAFLASLAFLIRTPFLLIRTPPLRPLLVLITALETLSPPIVTRGIRASTYGFWWDTSQSVTGSKKCLQASSMYFVGFLKVLWELGDRNSFRIFWSLNMSYLIHP